MTRMTDATGHLEGRWIAACIGSREITPDEAKELDALGAWITAHGGVVRSGGAEGADQAWATGGARTDPRAVVVCLPEAVRPGAVRGPRAPEGSVVLTPPWPDWVIEYAAAEFEFGPCLKSTGLPPYEEERDRERFATRSRWAYLESQRPYVARLMARNAAIVATAPRQPVHIVLALLNPAKKGGGGTGHAVRLGAALGAPVFNLREPECRDRVRQALRDLAAGRSIQSSAPTPPPAQGDLFASVTASPRPNR